MEKLTFFCAVAAIPVSGYVYIHTLTKQEDRKRERGCLLFGFFLLSVIVSMSIKESVRMGQMIYMVLGFPLLLLYIWREWQLTFRETVYYGVWAYMTWTLLVENWMICICAVPRDIGCSHETGWCLGLLASAALLGLAAVTIGRWIPEQGKKKIGPRQVSLAVCISMFHACLSILIHRWGMGENHRQWVPLFLFQVMLFLILYLQNEVFKKGDMKQELEVMNLLWKKEQEQYQLSKENIALINQKCHDLKHQIRAFRHTTGAEAGSYLKEIEKSIQIYENIVKTGNEVLDTILTEKSLMCKERGIVISCVADGSQLRFIDTVDLYAILGNALDNAIEAVENFEEEEKKLIDVLIYRQKQFLVINIINPMENALQYEDGLPVTTKGSRDYHGYGLRSIRFMLKKYDGTLSIRDEDNCFTLMMLIPIPDKQESVPLMK